ncbi:MAG: DUF4337 family protein [Candidatus Nitrosocosmicus sp.]
MSEPHETPHKLTKFFLAVSIFAIAASVLAIYSTIMGSENSSKKSDLQVDSLSHLTKSQDWWNDYQSHKLREKIFQVQVDNLNNTIHQQVPQLNKHDQDMYKNTLSRYQSLLAKLHANKTVADSIAYLNDKAATEEKAYDKSLIEFANTSKIIENYDLITILLIIGAGLTGLAEIAKNKLLAYAGFATGGLGIVYLIWVTINPI